MTRSVETFFASCLKAFALLGSKPTSKPIDPGLELSNLGTVVGHPPAAEEKLFRLAAHRSTDGSRMWWSSEPQPAQGELDEAKTLLRRAITNQAPYLVHDESWSIVERLDQYVESVSAITPADVKAIHMGFDQAHAIQAERIAPRLLDLVDDTPFAKGVVKYHVPLGSERSFLDENTRLRGLAWKSTLVADFVANVPEGVRRATHQLCCYVASRLERLTPSELHAVHAALESSIGEILRAFKAEKTTDVMDLMKETLRIEPQDGDNCVLLQRLAWWTTTALAQGAPSLFDRSAKVGGSRMQGVENGKPDQARLLLGLMEHARQVDRVYMDTENALVGTIMAMNHGEGLPGSSRDLGRGSADQYSKSYDALIDSVRDPETRRQLQQSSKAAWERDKLGPLAEFSYLSPLF